ncbi:hypothetical protein [Hydrogenimonas cancrithermarum]|uniref:hypothetical protein n=1 Tax=Hydrogenimonas cancrithermarum TaxID=2993563 RepID=UPI002573437B|nr:hypothetical protein [Hydrogenimonas cancrithermarum]
MKYLFHRYSRDGGGLSYCRPVLNGCCVLLEFSINGIQNRGFVQGLAFASPVIEVVCRLESTEFNFVDIERKKQIGYLSPLIAKFLQASTPCR